MPREPTTPDHVCRYLEMAVPFILVSRNIIKSQALTSYPHYSSFHPRKHQRFSQVYIKEGFTPIAKEIKDTIRYKLLSKTEKVLSKVRKPKVWRALHMAQDLSYIT